MEAQTIIKDVLNKGKITKNRPYDLGVRVNSVESGLCKDDLTSCLSTNNLPDTILLPKVETVEHVNWVNNGHF